MDSRLWGPDRAVKEASVIVARARQAALWPKARLDAEADQRVVDRMKDGPPWQMVDPEC